MHLAWLSDIHLNFPFERDVDNLFATLRESLPTRC